MLELVFIRHGQTAYNAGRKVMGRNPVPLNEEGRRQAGAVAARLRNVAFDAILSSPMQRAMETAGIIAAGREGIAVEACEGIAELDYGDWVGLSFDDVISRYAEEWQSYRADPANAVLPGGESIRDAFARIGAFIRETIARFGRGRVALVSHADVIKIAMLSALEMEPELMKKFTLDNCAVCPVRISKSAGAKLVLLGSSEGLASDVMQLDPKEAR